MEFGIIYKLKHFTFFPRGEPRYQQERQISTYFYRFNLWYVYDMIYITDTKKMKAC